VKPQPEFVPFISFQLLFGLARYSIYRHLLNFASLLQTSGPAMLFVASSLTDKFNFQF